MQATLPLTSTVTSGFMSWAREGEQGREAGRGTGKDRQMDRLQRDEEDKGQGKGPARQPGPHSVPEGDCAHPVLSLASVPHPQHQADHVPSSWQARREHFSCEVERVQRPPPAPSREYRAGFLSWLWQGPINNE